MKPTNPEPAPPFPSSRAAESTIGRFLALSPFERPDAALVVAAAAAGAFPVLDLGRDRREARSALRQLEEAGLPSFGMRFPDGVRWSEPLPRACRVVVFPSPEDVVPHLAEGRLVLTEVVDEDEAHAALDAAHGLVVKGNEAGGRVGEETSFVLLQHVARTSTLPLWLRGGIGQHTTAAAFAGGAFGVVLDAALALVRESRLDEPLRSLVAGMDGSEATVHGGMRVLARPELGGPRRDFGTTDDVRAELAKSPAPRLFAVGQDGAFAKELAARFRTATGLVHGLRAAAGAALRSAHELRPLAPDGAFAKAHGLPRPILQGPMTRVSDRPAFAEAVADAGGLPFLALSLLRGDESRKLLEETGALLGDKPWGVGILGFVPEELRAEQMEALAAVPPKVAIIAGGRPAQAAPLEARGTAVYLHVPSPGLLDLFLAEGARRFVFEGRECGGHVGPRTSFVLWEQQVSRLLAFLDAPRGKAANAAETPLSVVFAGGIHDARSAAMVAALAAPLAARGAEVAVLLGTAYLFTEEAVTSGAIGAVFQEEALACKHTALLETAPGHATRCAPTDYVRAFEAEKRRLRAEGTAPEEAWAALEQLNLGRLRIASKGLTRRGAELAAVDEATQRQDGMFMIGQVASLRRERTTMSALHHDVSEHGTALLARLAPLAHELAPPREVPVRPRADVAIVGMACVFPSAPDLATYWSNIVRGVDAIGEVPKDRWDPAIYFDAQGGTEKTPSKWGGFLEGIPFDPLSFGIPPKSLPSIEPVQLLSLEVARRALADAGYLERPFDRERTSVVFGAEGGTDLSNAYGFRALYPQLAGELPKALAEHLPSLTEDSFPGVLANVIAGRIANRLDLGGVNFTVDAACASSLAAVDVAVKELLSGGSDMVLCGGADLHNGIHDYLMFASVHALSPGGRCRTFDATADGISLGEGVGCLVLKRLADAERDGDRVYAVIRGIAGGSDGKSLGLTAPRKEGQIRAVVRAYAEARTSPAEVGLVEAHGTGTVVGDRTELATLTEVFQAAETPVARATLGSVKSQIGHTKCAAGLAGLIKAALAIHHGVLPPTLHVKQPNPYWDPSTSPFVFGDAARPWLEHERVAAVSAFGFGGTNFHCVLGKRGVPEEPGLSDWPAELFLLRGRDTAAALEAIDRLAALAREPRPLRELAAAASLAKGPVQAALVARDRAHLGVLLSALAAALGGDQTPLPEGVFRCEERAPQGGLAFLFPGQGSQRPGMLRELAVAFPSATRLLAREPELAARMMPPAAFSPEARARDLAALTDTRVAQPALGIADLLMAELFTRVGVRPGMAGGHSYGELVALTYAGALDESELVPLSRARAASILAAAGADPGAMAAVTASGPAVRRALADAADVVIANENAPDQTVIAGPTAALEEALTRLAAAGLEAKRLQVACAFHSPVVARAKALFGAELAAVPLRVPLLPVYSNVTAAPHERHPEAIRERLAEHVVSPVLFARQIEAMYAAGARVFVEVGPGRVLTGLVRKILGNRPHRALASDQSTGSGVAHFLTALAELATLGVPVEPRPLFAARGVPVWDLARPPAAGPSPSTWLVTGQLARPLSGELPPGSLRPTLAPVLRPGAANDEAPASSEEGVVLQYLSSMRELARAQRDVMLRFLGTAPQGLVFDATFEEAPEATRGALAKAAASPTEAPTVTVPAALATEELLLSIVAERTGYPVEMLDLDLNLEAELSIDSIKRIEILGVLSVRLGISQTGTDEAKKIVEQLARVKTLRGILDWLDARAKGELPEAVSAPQLSAPALPTLPSPSIRSTLAPGSMDPAPPAPEPPSRVATKTDEVVRLVPRAARRELGTQGSVRGKRYAVTDDGEGFAPGMVEWLEAAGARATLVSRNAPLAGFDGVVDLAGLGERASEPNSVSRSALSAFELVQRVAEARSPRFVAAAWLAEGSAAGEPGRFVPPLGWSGLVRSLVKERPETRASIVGLEPTTSPELLIERLGAELARGDDVEVHWVHGERHAVGLVPAEALAERSDALLAPGSVVLVTGGARGVTAAISVALAERFGATLELVGRTPFPGEEEPALVPHGDARALRKHLAARGDLAGPRAIEAAVQSILAAREVRGTFAELARLGVRARYHALDVRDDEAFGELVERLYAEHGRIDGIVHGAGVVEDRLLEQKTADSFSRVFDTKVRPALVLAERLRAPCRFVAFFGSVVGALGNVGQADYAAANAALETIARGLTSRVSGRVVCLGWGPWSGAGMVNDDLARAYERAGVTLLSLADGVDAFLREVASPGGPSAVIVRGDRADPLRAFRRASAATG